MVSKHLFHLVVFGLQIRSLKPPQFLVHFCTPPRGSLDSRRLIGPLGRSRSSLSIPGHDSSTNPHRERLLAGDRRGLEVSRLRI